MTAYQITQTITDPGVAPQRTDPDNFDARADAFTSALAAWGAAGTGDLNVLRDQMNALSTAVNGYSVAADASAVTSAAQAVLAAASATAAENASNATAYDTGIVGGYAVGDVVYSTAGNSYRCIQVQAEGAVEALSNAAYWTLLGGKTLLVKEDRTSNTVLAATDFGKRLDITSGTFTQTFTAAATLGSGWYLIYGNSGTGNITLDPDGTDEIDGLTDYIVYPGEVRIIQCDGTGFNSVVLNSFYLEVLTTSTFVTPPGYPVFGSIIWSGAGSGASTDTPAGNAMGGAGGGCFRFELPSDLFGATETVTIGAGGASVTGTIGLVGGNSSIGTIAIVYAGAAPYTGGSVLSGAAVSTSPAESAGANGATNGIPSIWGGAGPSSSGGASILGNSVHGGAAGGTHDGTNARAGGTSVYGGDGGAASVTGAATAGSVPGGGGGMSKGAHASGAGGNGKAIIWGII